MIVDRKSDEPDAADRSDDNGSQEHSNSESVEHNGRDRITKKSRAVSILAKNFMNFTALT